MERFANNAATTLSAAITTNNQDTIAVTSASSFPDGQRFRIRIDDELLLVIAVQPTYWIVERGVEGTTATTHANGSTVTQVLTAGAIAQTKREIGSNHYVPGVDAAGIGAGNVASGNYSLATGKATNAQGDCSVAFGNGTVARLPCAQYEGISFGSVQRFRLIGFGQTGNNQTSYILFDTVTGTTDTLAPTITDLNWLVRFHCLAVDSSQNCKAWSGQFVYQNSIVNSVGEFVGPIVHNNGGGISAFSAGNALAACGVNELACDFAPSLSTGGIKFVISSTQTNDINFALDLEVLEMVKGVTGGGGYY